MANITPYILDTPDSSNTIIRVKQVYQIEMLTSIIWKKFKRKSLFNWPDRKMGQHVLK